MRLILLLLLAYLLLVSCHSSKNRYHQLVFKHQEDISLHGANYGTFYSVQWEGKDKQSLVCFNYKLNRVYRFDFAKRQLIDSMNLLPVQGINNPFAQIGAIHYVNPDSIYILFNPVYKKYKRYYHDSSIVLINRNREIKGVFSFKGAPVLSEENPPIGKPTIQSLYLNYFKDHSPLLVQDNRMYANFSIHVKMMPGDSLYANYQLPLIGSFDLNQTRPTYQAEEIYTYPWPVGNQLTSEYKNKSLTPGYQNELLISYPMTPNVVRYDPIYKTKQFLPMPSLLFDTIQRPDTFKDLALNVNTETLLERHLPFYGIVKYDKENDVYLRSISYPCTVGATPSQLSTHHHGLIYRNRASGILAEGLLPEKFNMEIAVFDKDGLLFFNSKKSKEGEKTIVLSRYTYRPKPIRKAKLRQSIEKQIYSNPNPLQAVGIDHYIAQETRLKPSNQMVVLMPMFSSCPNTFNRMCKYLKETKDSLQGRSVYFLFMDGNDKEFKTIQLEYGFSAQDSMIISELNKKHKQYMPFFLDPRVIVFDQGKIIQDNNLGLREIHRLPQIVQDYIQRKPNPATVD